MIAVSYLRKKGKQTSPRQLNLNKNAENLTYLPYVCFRNEFISVHSLVYVIIRRGV